MKEKEFIMAIKNVLQSDYIGDDCAYLKDLGLTITQDSLVQDVHFKTEFTTPYQLGYKSIMVNLSDIAASGAEPKYLTVSLSLPDCADKNFIEEFYSGAKAACTDEIKIVGGDLTASDKIFISVCAIGKTENRNISSRKNAQIGQKIIVSGNFGSSAAGLELLTQNKTQPEKFIKEHLEPKAQIEFSKKISLFSTGKYAMMDTSDGLMDALSTIANESKVLIDVDFDKIPHDKDLEKFPNWQEMILFGGEDYQIAASVEQNCPYGITIGTVKSGLGVNLKINNSEKLYTKTDVENRIYNHWK